MGVKVIVAIGFAFDMNHIAKHGLFNKNDFILSTKVSVDFFVMH